MDAMSPAAVGMVGTRNANDKDNEGVAEHRSKWEALLRSFNFTPEQEAELPAIRQGAERLSDYEELWRMEEPGKPLSEVGCGVAPLCHSSASQQLHLCTLQQTAPDLAACLFAQMPPIPMPDFSSFSRVYKVRLCSTSAFVCFMPAYNRHSSPPFTRRTVA